MVDCKDYVVRIIHRRNGNWKEVGLETTHLKFDVTETVKLTVEKDS